MMLLILHETRSRCWPCPRSAFCTHHIPYRSVSERTQMLTKSPGQKAYHMRWRAGIIPLDAVLRLGFFPAHAAQNRKSRVLRKLRVLVREQAPVEDGAAI